MGLYRIVGELPGARVVWVYIEKWVSYRELALYGFI